MVTVKIAGELDDAISSFRAALEIDADDILVRAGLWDALLANGDFDEAVPSDIAGSDRSIGPETDMGAYEYEI